MGQLFIRGGIVWWSYPLRPSPGPGRWPPEPPAAGVGREPQVRRARQVVLPTLLTTARITPGYGAGTAAPPLSTNHAPRDPHDQVIVI